MQINDSKIRDINDRMSAAELIALGEQTCDEMIAQLRVRGIAEPSTMAAVCGIVRLLEGRKVHWSKQGDRQDERALLSRGEWMVFDPMGDFHFMPFDPADGEASKRLPPDFYIDRVRQHRGADHQNSAAGVAQTWHGVINGPILLRHTKQAYLEESIESVSFDSLCVIAMLVSWREFFRAERQRHADEQRDRNETQAIADGVATMDMGLGFPPAVAPAQDERATRESLGYTLLKGFRSTRDEMDKQATHDAEGYALRQQSVADKYTITVEGGGLGTGGRPAACCVCGCTDARACVGKDGVACHWIAPGLCSACKDFAEVDELNPLAPPAARRG